MGCHAPHRADGSLGTHPTRGTGPWERTRPAVTLEGPRLFDRLGEAIVTGPFEWCHAGAGLKRALGDPLGQPVRTATSAKRSPIAVSTLEDLVEELMEEIESDAELPPPAPRSERVPSARIRR
jgi:hypothetical protein